MALCGIILHHKNMRAEKKPKKKVGFSRIVTFSKNIMGNHLPTNDFTWRSNQQSSASEKGMLF